MTPKQMAWDGWCGLGERQDVAAEKREGGSRLWGRRDIHCQVSCSGQSPSMDYE